LTTNSVWNDCESFLFTPTPLFPTTPPLLARGHEKLCTNPWGERCRLELEIVYTFGRHKYLTKKTCVIHFFFFIFEMQFKGGHQTIAADAKKLMSRQKF